MFFIKRYDSADEFSDEMWRQSDVATSWRKAVYEKDDYTCQRCGGKGRLNAHHKERFRMAPELRFNLLNGKTLCKKCHKLTHKEGSE